MSDKFPGSWRMVAVLCAAIVGAQALRAVLLRPTVARLTPESQDLAGSMGAGTGPGAVASSSAIETLRLLERYQDQFTPELDVRARALADQLGANSARLPSARTIFLLLAGRNMLVAPDVLMLSRPEGWEVVCGEQGPEYVCLTVTSHIIFLAEHPNPVQPNEDRSRGGR